MHLNAVSLFRLLGAVSRTMSYANAISYVPSMLLCMELFALSLAALCVC